MPDVPPGFIADFLRLVGFMVAVGALAIVARQFSVRYARRRGATGLASFVASPPGTFLLVILSFVLCLLGYLAFF